MSRIVAVIGHLAARLLAWLRAYSTSHWLIASLVVLMAVWVVPFQATGQPQATVDAIAWGWWPIVVTYAAIALALVACTWARLRRDIRRAVNGPRIPSAPSRHAVELDVATFSELADVRTALESAGFTCADSLEGMSATRNRWSPLGGSIFHVAILLFAAGVALHQFTAQTIQLRVSEAQPFISAIDPSHVWAVRLLDGATLTSIEPEYFEDVLLFTRLDATIAHVDGRMSRMSLSDPKWLDPFTRLSIQDYGLAPVFVVEDATGRILEDAVVAMNIFPPGAQDSVDLEQPGLRISVVAFPDHGVVDARDVSLSYNIANPKFRLGIYEYQKQGESVRALVAPGERVEIGGLQLYISDVAKYGTFVVQRSYATLPVAAGGLLMLLGLCLRTFAPRHDVVVWRHADRLYLDSWLDAAGRDAGIERALRIVANRGPADE